MNNTEEIQINQYLRDIFDEDREIRIKAITQLGEIGDELCLLELKEQLHHVTFERDALISSIIKLKDNLASNN